MIFINNKFFIQFTVSQLLQHNIHLGVLLNFIVLSSFWFITGLRQKFTIINLFLTFINFKNFFVILSNVVISRKSIVFINEHKSFDYAVSEVSNLIGEPYVMGYWIGGVLTNFKKLLPAYLKMTTFKRIRYCRSNLNLKQSMQGFKFITSLPGAAFINSVNSSYLACKEVAALKIPAGGVLDTDSFPRPLLYLIPGNDDSFSSISFLNRLVAKVVINAKARLIHNLFKKLLINRLLVSCESLNFSKNLIRKSKKHKSNILRKAPNGDKSRRLKV